MMYTAPFSPLRLHDPRHVPIQIAYGPRRQCGRPPRHCGRPAFGPPAWVFSRPQHHGNRFAVGPFVEDVVDIWKSMLGVPDQGKDKQQSVKPYWGNEIDCEGYSADEVKLESSGGKIFVTGSHENNDGNGNTEIRQMKRTITLPSDVNEDEMKATFDNKGVLRLSAPRKTEKNEKTDMAVEQIPDKASETAPDNAAEADGVCVECMENEMGETTEPQAQQMEIQKHDSSVLENSEAVLKERIPSPQEDTRTILKPQRKPFELTIDMKRFNPESIEVKLNENTITIRGNREDTDEQTGKILSSQTVFRRLVLPDDVNTDLLQSKLDKQGQLTISAPYKADPQNSEKLINTISVD